MLALAIVAMAAIAAWVTAGVLLFFIGCVVDYRHGDLKETVADLILATLMCAILGPTTLIPLMEYAGEQEWLGNYSQIVHMYGRRAALWCERNIGNRTRKILQARIQ